MPITIKNREMVAIVTIDNPPVNATSVTVRKGLLDAFHTLESDSNIKAVVLHCAGRTFIAGGDIKEFDTSPQKPQLPEVIHTLEFASKPWIAAMHGTVLGGGLEVALGCHYRCSDSATQFGFPEVKLGLIPGAGGTVRLPRLIGASAALDMITSGKSIGASAALQCGLIDRIFEKSLIHSAVEFAQHITQSPQPLSEKPLQRSIDSAAFTKQKDRIRARARGQIAPLVATEALENALSLPADKALKAERELFLNLQDGAQSSAMRYIFFAERSAGKLPKLSGVDPRAYQQIGVIGGGTMGAGIAAACLLANLSVTMIERDQSSLQLGQERVQEILSDSLKRQLISPEKHKQLLEQLTVSIDYESLSSADLVIEAVFEDMEIKHAVFRLLDQVTRIDCLLASNTSYLDINTIAKATKDPTRVIGLHFFSPAHIMKLLELVVTDVAADEVLATGLAFAKHLRKIPVRSGVCDGFIGNRMMSAYRRECEYMLEDGALPEEVDAAMREFGFAMGVFEMQDMAGLDIAWAMRKRQAASRPKSQRYVDIPDRLCEQGRFGRKAGHGWYRYNNNIASPDPLVTELILKESKRKKIARKSLGPNEIMQRIHKALRKTGYELLGEGIASSAEDIDVVMVNGYGYPRHKGGPMYKPKPH